jgi:ABC-type sugar transport system ATPase subunit
MNEGKVVQIGRPLDVYRKPADTFVARFLGNPPMNLLRGRLEAQDGRPIACFAGNAVALPKRAAADLVQHIGHDVIIGLRPEDLYETAPAGGPAEIARLPARVVAVEPLGAETLLLVALDGSNEELVARIGRDTDLSSGERLDIALDSAALHLFDPATTRAIT